jgi:hypothetical protein
MRLELIMVSGLILFFCVGHRDLDRQQASFLPGVPGSPLQEHAGVSAGYKGNGDALWLMMRCYDTTI